MAQSGIIQFLKKYDFQGLNQMKVCIDPDVDASNKSRWNRMDRVVKVVDIRAGLAQGLNQSEASKKSGVPRTTLQYWLSRKSTTGVSLVVEAFFETPDGLSFLHQLVIAAQFVMSKVGSCGTDLMSLFLRMSQLDQFVACSHGSVHNMSVKMEEAILAFGKMERSRLSLTMPQKKISICQDETFHPEICLVAMEPVSNFILLEQYDEKRDAEAWSKAMQVELATLPVEIVQSTSDEGRGLIKYVEQELGAHHSPDLFHVQQELTRATAAPIRSKLKKAETISQTGTHIIERLERQKNTDTKQIQVSSSEFDEQLHRAKVDEAVAQHQVVAVKKLQADVKEAKKALGDAYHPYDMQTGKAQTADVVSSQLEMHFNTIQAASEELDLSENSMKRLDKAHRVFKAMIKTIVFFWTMVTEQVASLELSPELEQVMNDVLIPVFYLQISAKKARKAVDRHRINQLAIEILARLELIDSWCALPQSKREQMNTLAKHCATLFQRSSSCVEGRNGYLALRHHSSHQLSNRKLCTLTIIHNFFIRRADGTTAAERFFEQKQKNLFQYLLDHLALPARPAKSRKESAMAA